MAKMYPNKPRAGTTSEAEKSLFREFEKQLPDTYLVYHSVAWQVRDQNRGYKDGEADFVIIDPEIGILVLEVKGGIISHDRGEDQWMSNTNSIKDPFQQARGEKYNLLTKLKESIGESYYFNIGYGVAFPDAEVVDGFGMDKPREIIIDSSDINSLLQWIQSFFSRLRPPSGRSRPLDNYALEKIEKLFNPSWRFSEFITNYFSKLNVLIEQLTEEQYIILDYLKRHRKAAISGSAGSGKTLVALEKAIRLRRDGFSVLLLCHNPYLANSLRLRIGETGIQVYDFRRFIDFINGQDEKTTNPDFTPKIPWTQFDEPSSNALDSAYKKLSSKDTIKFDAVIVDEGQDFRENWWQIAEACLGDRENGIFYVFFDERQILSPVEHLRPFVPLAPFDLSKNCRNSGEIYKIVQQLGESMPSANEELAGKGVVREWLYTSDDDLYQNLKDALVNAESYSDELSEIVVVTAELKPVEKSRLNGMVFDTPALQKLSGRTPSEWRNAVLRYLIPRGADRSLVSNEIMPTERDRNYVKEFSSRWLDRNRTSSYSLGKNHMKRIVFKWAMDNYGKLSLYNYEQLVSENDVWEIMLFFSTRDWSTSLPQPRKLYRLSHIDDIDNYPTYRNVQLVNIPTFKGLEANGVVFVCHDYTGGYDSFLRASLYVGLSRARHLLNIVTAKPIQDEITRLNKYAYR